MDLYVHSPSPRKMAVFPTENPKIAGIKIHPLASDIDGLTSPEIKKLATNSTAEWIGFSNVSHADTVIRLVNSLPAERVDNDRAIVSILTTSCQLAKLWKDLHPFFAASVFNPFALGLVAFRRSTLLDAVEDVPGPLRACLLQTAKQSQNVNVAIADADSADQVELNCPVLVPGRTSVMQQSIVSQIESTPFDNLGLRIRDDTEAKALRAGLLLFQDALDGSHSYSQSIEGRGRDNNGDYWHAIMHRREADYSNSKYWFRQVGRHPIFTDLARFASSANTNLPESIKSRFFERSEWKPFAFVDVCQQAEISDNAVLTTFARRVQFEEMLLLLAYTCQCAVE